MTNYAYNRIGFITRSKEQARKLCKELLGVELDSNQEFFSDGSDGCKIGDGYCIIAFSTAWDHYKGTPEYSRKFSCPAILEYSLEGYEYGLETYLNPNWDFRFGDFSITIPLNYYSLYKSIRERIREELIDPILCRILDDNVEFFFSDEEECEDNSPDEPEMLRKIDGKLVI